MKYFLRAGIAIVLIGMLSMCKNIAVTDTEVEAVQHVLDFYGGVCNRSKGFKTEDGKTNTYFELEMSQSELLEKYAKILEMPASNIAYLFYSKLKDEKDNYTQVKVNIKLKNGKLHEYNYSVDELKEIEKLTPVLESVSDRVKTKDYNELHRQFDAEVASGITIEEMNKYCSKYDSAYGNVNKTQFQGFSFFNAEKDGRPLVHLAGIMMRPKGNTPLSIYVDRRSKKVMLLKYEF